MQDLPLKITLRRTTLESAREIMQAVRVMRRPEIKISCYTSLVIIQMDVNFFVTTVKNMRANGLKKKTKTVIEYRIVYGTRVLYEWTRFSLGLDSIRLNVRRT